MLATPISQSSAQISPVFQTQETPGLHSPSHTLRYFKTYFKLKGQKTVQQSVPYHVVLRSMTHRSNLWVTGLQVIISLFLLQAPTQLFFDFERTIIYFRNVLRKQFQPSLRTRE